MNNEPTTADLAVLAAELAEHYASEPCGRCGGDGPKGCECLTPAENE